jgi:hypothetical protein
MLAAFCKKSFSFSQFSIRSDFLSHGLFLHRAITPTLLDFPLEEGIPNACARFLLEFNGPNNPGLICIAKDHKFK